MQAEQGKENNLQAQRYRAPFRINRERNGKEENNHHRFCIQHGRRHRSVKKIYNICSSLNAERLTPNALFYIDDAHGTGVLGNGKGALAHFGIKPEPWIIQMGTFSKALGSFGAFAAGSKDSIEWILNTARSFIFSTALPSCAAAASIAALEVIEREPELLNKLWANREQAVHGITKLGYDIMGSETPIIPVRTGTVDRSAADITASYGKRHLCPCNKAAVCKRPRIRIAVTSAHTAEDIERLVKALGSITVKAVNYIGGCGWIADSS